LFSIQSFNGFSAVHSAQRKPARFKGHEDVDAEYSREYGPAVKKTMDSIIQAAQGKPIHAKQKQAYEDYCDGFHPLHQQMKTASQQDKKSLRIQMAELVRNTWDIVRKSPDDPSFEK